MPLMPKKTKFRKQQKGRNRGKATRGNKVYEGDYGLQALEGQVWIKIFPDKPVTAKPIGTRMGKGKGNVEKWVAPVKPGRVMFEIGGVPEATAKEALRLAGSKLSVKTRVIKKETELGGDVDEDK